LDNDERKTRILELGDQTKLDLESAASEYADFKLACVRLNPKLAAFYTSAGLAAPPQKTIEVMKYTQLGTEENVSEVAEVLEAIADVTLFVGLTQQLGPAATKFLVNKQLITEEFAEKQLVSKCITIYEDALGRSKGVEGADGVVEIEITAGDVAGHVVAGIFAGIAVGVLDGIIWRIEEEILKGELQTAITALHPLRTATLLCRKRTMAALDSIQSIDALVDALDAAEKEKKAEALSAQRNVIAKTVVAAINKGATLDDVVAELKKRDADNGSVTSDDPDYPAAVAPAA
jgi:hypothetical protein